MPSLWGSFGDNLGSSKDSATSLFVCCILCRLFNQRSGVQRSLRSAGSGTSGHGLRAGSAERFLAAARGDSRQHPPLARTVEWLQELLVAPLLLVASLFLVVMPGATSSFLLLVAMHLHLVTSSFLLPIVMPGAFTSFLLLVAMHLVASGFLRPVLMPGARCTLLRVASCH